MSEARFDAGVAHLHRYVAAYGTSNPRQRDTIDGFPIGRWVDSRRTEYRRGRLSAERIRTLRVSAGKMGFWRPSKLIEETFRDFRSADT
ncbi:helicase associated domain-containing protein [Gordonia sp. NPDC062954]|uniref:helicase associated domain-containing protein n=1 Tax=unclassified Gordonia (in: high G+C Gram-positive bacteria) TaxID=2657482 RepID=UPI000A02B72E|nr:helicase associated domain-containing protein [Gordonia sp. CNJ-863]